ncbi:MAG: hypothetical protein ACE5JU_21445, partial [Candidatus Binatia bacterium]
ASQPSPNARGSPSAARSTGLPATRLSPRRLRLWRSAEAQLLRDSLETIRFRVLRVDGTLPV